MREVREIGEERLRVRLFAVLHHRLHGDDEFDLIAVGRR